MSTPLRVALIGAGRYAGLMEDDLPPGSPHRPYSHAAAFLAEPETAIVAVAGDDPAALTAFRARYPGLTGYTDYRHMLETEQPDLVSITAPAHQRAAQMSAAAEAGVRGIFTDKGLCRSLTEADTLAATLRRHRVAFNWGALRRYHAGYQAVAAAIAGGEIGEPRYVVTSYFSDLLSHQSHALDTAAMLLGDPAPVWVAGELIDPGDRLAAGRALPHYDPDRHQFVAAAGQASADPVAGVYRVGYASGAEALCLPVPGKFELEVLGTAGRIQLWDNGTTLRAVRHTGGARTAITWAPAAASPTWRGVADLVAAVRAGAPEQTRGGLASTLPTLEVQFGLVESHLRGSAQVALPLADRSLVIDAV